MGASAVVPSSFASDASDAVATIEATWGRLFEAIGCTPDTCTCERIGITTPADDQVPPQRFTYVAAVVIDDESEIAPGLAEANIDAGLYAVFTYDGPHDGLDEFYRRTYMEDLAAAGWRTRDGQHLEKYLPSAQPEHIVSEAWIPIITE
jgi:predicted transcriptional regulator YdeE